MKSLESIKRRINSIDTTKKITNAMKLVATAKLKKQRAEFDKALKFNLEFYCIVRDLIDSIKDTKYLANQANNNKTLWVVITSNLGLCGSYNTNSIKMLISQINKNDKCIIIGQKGYALMRNYGYENQISQVVNLECNNFNYVQLLHLTDEIIEAYQNNEYESVKIIYTKYFNSLSFEPVVNTILPLDKQLFEGLPKVNNYNSKEIEFEPSKEAILKDVLPTLVSIYINGALLESVVSENASRKNAMDNAVNNATELKEKLKLQYNQARQESITQEINEIVAGADSK